MLLMINVYSFCWFKAGKKLEAGLRHFFLVLFFLGREIRLKMDYRWTRIWGLSDSHFFRILILNPALCLLITLNISCFSFVRSFVISARITDIVLISWLWALVNLCQLPDSFSWRVSQKFYFPALRNFTHNTCKWLHPCPWTGWLDENTYQESRSLPLSSCFWLNQILLLWAGIKGKPEV